MSLWRSEALRRLPEFHRTIVARDVDNPMMLWIELRLSFMKLCEQDPPPVEQIRRIWGYAAWCMERGHPDVGTAAAVGFCEHLLDSEPMRALLPFVMARHDYVELRDLLLYHNPPVLYEEVLGLFEKRR